MDILLKSARIIDSESTYHNKVRDILISGGVIQQVSESIPLAVGLPQPDGRHIAQRHVGPDG